MVTAVLRGLGSQYLSTYFCVVSTALLVISGGKIGTISEVVVHIC